MTRSAAGAMEPGRAAQGRWRRHVLAFGAMALLLLGVGVLQSWSVMLAIVNLCLISAILALGADGAAAKNVRAGVTAGHLLTQ